MKHSYWWLDNGEQVKTVFTCPEITQETATVLAARCWPGFKIEPGLAPSLPHDDASS